MTFIISAQSRAVRAIGPVLERSPVSDGGQAGTRPNVAFSPTRPVKLAGMRPEPRPSVPMAIGPRPAATAAPAPPDEPPGVRATFQGLRVMPFSGESVTPLWPYSELVLWAKTIGPASRSRATAGASASAGALSVSLLPIEAGHPSTRTSSLIETGTPSSADSGSPFFQRRSEARAALSAAPASIRVKALISGPTFAARARTAFMVSTGVAWPGPGAARPRRDRPWHRPQARARPARRRRPRLRGRGPERSRRDPRGSPAFR